jgi:alpha-tubulin suppressor-like RCC1 family protein
MRRLIAVGMLSALAICLWAPVSAQAEQALPHGRSALFDRIDAGPSSSCAIAADGSLRCWGDNSSGQLGYGNTAAIGDNETPASVPPVDLGAGRTAVKVATGGSHTCAILDDGSVLCWGQGVYGQLGYGNTNNIGDNESPASAGPVAFGFGRKAVAISAGDQHTCVILDDGAVNCWGSNGNGQLGYPGVNQYGDDEPGASGGPVNLGAGRTAVAINASREGTCAILDNGTVRCWGNTAAGVIGDNETPGSVAPVDFGTGHTAVAIAGGITYTCAILDDGTVRCWGIHAFGRLGYGNETNVVSPASVGPVDLGAGRTAVAISASESHVCAVLDNGTVRCWGRGMEGQLGYANVLNIGDNETPGTVGPVDLGSGRFAVGIATGSFHSCAMLDNGTVRCWGNGASGRLGYANTASIGDNETPAAAGPVALGSALGATEIVAGGKHSCALFSNGTVRCWGDGSSGQLGYANTANIGDDESVGSAGPVDLGAHSAVEIALGESHTCALLDNGTILCWGNGANGRLGYASTANVGDNETPGSVGPVNLGGKTAVSVSAGNAHTCAVLADGTVRCWGDGASGRLGYGNTTTIGDTETPGSVGPVSLGTNHTALAVAAGGSHTCALLDDHTVSCWGLGTSGQLGYANTTAIGDDELPSVAGVVAVGRSVVSLSAGASHTCANLDNGSIRCWGLAASGQLGYANTTTIGDSETPASAGPLTLAPWGTATGVTAGGAHTCAITSEGLLRCWGLASSGQLGLANTTTIGDDESPNSVLVVDVGGGRSTAEVSAGSAHTCAILDNGTVRCWGLNDKGQLGNGNTTTIGDNESPGSAGTVVDFVDDPPTAVNDSVTVGTVGNTVGKDVGGSLAKKLDLCLDAGAPGGQSLSATFKRNRRRQITVAFGASAKIEGKLTSASGQPLAGASICVETQTLDQRDSVSLIARAATDASGNFSYPLSSGPSRAITVAYRDGARQIERRLLYFARARPSLHASPLHLGNGQLVHFHGRLPNPGAGGRVVIIQASTAGSSRWITFRKATTNAKGSFNTTYRFTATASTTRYRFRALVPRQAGYPWREGHCKAVEVTVNP